MTRLTLLLLLLASGCRCGSPPADRVPPTPVGSVSIPRASGPIVIDGKCLDTSWQHSYRSPVFQDSDGHVAPFTELRAVADDENLYLAVYVGDIDIRSEDLVRLTVGPVRVELRPKGSTAPPGVRFATDTDDSIDNPKDLDEEWVNEVAIPWSMLGSHSVPVRALRIDVGHGERPHALAWPRAAPILMTFDAHAGK